MRDIKLNMLTTVTVLRISIRKTAGEELCLKTELVASIKDETLSCFRKRSPVYDRNIEE